MNWTTNRAHNRMQPFNAGAVTYVGLVGHVGYTRSTVVSWSPLRRKVTVQYGRGWVCEVDWSEAAKGLRRAQDIEKNR